MQEILGAYLDGELAAADTARLEARLARDPALRIELDALRRQAAQLRSASAAAAREPVPERLVSAVERGFAARRRRVLRRPARFALPLAASLLVVLASGIAAYVASDIRMDRAVREMAARRAEEQRIVARTINRALETTLSGTALPWQAAGTGTTGTVAPTRTWRSTSGHWCREYRLVRNDPVRRESWRGVACRTADGNWWTVERRYYRP